VGTLRRAEVADAAELVRLRAVMAIAMGQDVDVPGWRSACTAAFTRRLAGPDFVAYVVGGGVGEPLLSCGVGWVEEHLPGPLALDGRRGHIASMATDVAARRRGYARLVFGALMEWFAELGVPRIDLRATPDGAPLYRAFGFAELGGLTMAWTAAGTRPGMPALRR
jgi:ribosomal protein S18 acetylase RimI-like enzyme